MSPTLQLQSTRPLLLRSLTLLLATTHRASVRPLLLGLSGVGKLLVVDQAALEGVANVMEPFS